MRVTTEQARSTYLRDELARQAGENADHLASLRVEHLIEMQKIGEELQAKDTQIAALQEEVQQLQEALAAKKAPTRRKSGEANASGK